MGRYQPGDKPQLIMNCRNFIMSVDTTLKAIQILQEWGVVKQSAVKYLRNDGYTGPKEIEISPLNRMSCPPLSGYFGFAGLDN